MKTWNIALVTLVLSMVGAVYTIKYKREADRDACRLNIRNVHQAMRAYQGVNGNYRTYSVGDKYKVDDLLSYYLDGNVPTCPSGGTYTISDVIPKVGDHVITCSHPEHTPSKSDIVGW